MLDLKTEIIRNGNSDVSVDIDVDYLNSVPCHCGVGWCLRVHPGAVWTRSSMSWSIKQNLFILPIYLHVHIM